MSAQAGMTHPTLLSVYPNPYFSFTISVMIILFNKPYQVLCQFTDGENRQTLANFIDVPNVYPAGRLDYDSEGLLILTDDGKLQHRISDPKYKLAKTYWVQVEKIPEQDALTQLCRGVQLNDGPAHALSAKLIDEPTIWQRFPPIRERKSIATQWLEIAINEGRNRQVRRMTAAIGFPTLRLIRCRIGEWSIEGLKPGEWRVV